jgi:hypothetical protein
MALHVLIACRATGYGMAAQDSWTEEWLTWRCFADLLFANARLQKHLVLWVAAYLAEG